ncbi:MAG: hypothetical protein LBO80_00195 [Treponema sp.]|jgi:hypothetical protein|nr:hypothetical protein [Treponema sp.]
MVFPALKRGAWTRLPAKGVRTGTRRRILRGILFLLLLSGKLPLHGDEAGGGEAPETPPPALELDVESLRRRITSEASPELMSVTVGSTDVSLLVSGYWKGTLTGSWGIALTPLGVSAASGDSPILFQQEADLTLSLWIRKRWFVEASFLDDYDLNTYRAGYQGFPGEFVQYVGVGNTGLDYPAFPYLDLGGDSPSSFGAYGKFGVGPVTIHSLIRYDAAVREERTFVGERERTYGYVALTSPLRGLSFVLPDDNITAVPVVYFEDSNGNLSDTDGRRWRLAQASEYAVSARYGLVELSSVPKGMVAVSYPGGYSMGSSYSLPTDFLGEVQNRFNPVNLSDYPQPGQRTASPGSPANIPGTVSINGTPSLVIYEPGTFSPFERQSRYGAPTSNAVDAALIKLSTGDRIRGFEVLSVADISLSANIPLYAGTPSASRSVYEIVGGRVSQDRRSAEERWPLAAEYPEIYLPGKTAFPEDIRLRFTNYGGSGYSLGTDVVPGSVQVFRGGVEDPRIRYNPDSGTVQLETPAGFNEVIRITYLKQGDQSRMGSLAAGIGAVYDAGGRFSSALGIGMRWNITGESYTEEGVSSPGTVGLGAKAAWDYDALKIQVTTGFGFEQPDTTGLYRLAGMEGSEIILGFSDSTSFISEVPVPNQAAPLFSGLTLSNRTPLVYRNFRNTDLFGSTSIMDIGWSGASVVSGESGPYLARDSVLASEILAAEFDTLAAGSWTGFQVPLGEDGAAFEGAEQIQVPYRFYDIATKTAWTPALTDFRMIIQFGSLSNKDSGGSGGNENPGLIVEANIPYAGSSGIAGFTLNDEDRRKLLDAKYMRLIIINTGSSPVNDKAVLIARPIIRGSGFRPITADPAGTVSRAPDGNAGFPSVSAAEVWDPSLSNSTVSRLHSGGGQRVLEVKWHDLAAYSDTSAAGIDGRTSAIPLSNYRTLSFFIKGPDTASPLPPGSAFRFIAGRGPNGPAALEAKDIDAGLFTPGQWSKVEIRYGGGDSAVYVNGARTGSVFYRPSALRKSGSEAPGMGGYAEDSSGQSGYAALYLKSAGPSLPDGTFSVDEIILEDPSPSYRFNGGTVVEWNRPGELLSVNGAAVLSDVKITTALESGVRGDPFTPESELFYGVMNRSRLETKFLGAALSTDISFLSANDYSYWTAGHGVSRSWGPFSLGESFAAAPHDRTMNHHFSLGWSSLIRSSFNADIVYEYEKLQRQWRASLGVTPNPETASGVSFDADWRWSENTNQPDQWMPNYAETWARSWEPLMPDPGGGASRRDAHGLFRAALDTRPVGLEFSIDGSSNFSKPVNSTQSATTGRLDFPFVFGNYRGLFRGERYFTRSLFYSGNDFRNDQYKYLESLADTPLLWLTPPLYSFFDPFLPGTLDRSLSKSDSAEITEYGRFSDRLALTLQFPGSYGLSSLFIPRSFQYQMDRTLEHKLDTRTDVLNTGVSLGFQGINMFGAFGAKPLFTFYENDEISHSLGAAAAFPKGEDPSWRIQAEQSMDFYGFLGSRLSLTNTFTMSDSGWVESLTIDWTVLAKKTILGLLYDWTANKIENKSTWPALSSLAAAEYERLRKESMELMIDNSGGYTRFSLILGHESIIRVMGRLYLSVFAKLDCTQDERTEILSFIGTVGTTLNITF